MNWGLVWAAITAFGTVLAGLALPLAFIQLRALRQDRLRTQVSKVGAWTGQPRRTDEVTSSWTIPLLVRNGSELPVWVNAVGMNIDPGQVVRSQTVRRVRGVPVAEEAPESDRLRRTQFHTSPGAVAPGETWQKEITFDPGAHTRHLAAAVYHVAIIDTAGHQWEMRPGAAGPARLVRRERQDGGNVIGIRGIRRRRSG